MLDMFSDDIRRDPYPLYAQLRGTPLLHMPTLGLWLVSDHEGVRRALIDSDGFSSSVDLATGKTPDWLVFSDPPRHTRLRAILLRAFTPRSIAGLEPRVRELSRELLAPGLARGEFDLALDYAGPLPTLVIAEMIGIPIADRPRFIRWTEAILGLSQALVGGEAAALAIAEHAAVKQEIADYLDAAIAARRDAPQDDLLGRLVAAEIDGERLSHAEIVGFVQFLLAAGTETTANVIANAFLELAEHPELRDRLRDAPGLLPTAIEEFVRHRSPLQLAFRETRRPIELHGQTIPAGRLVLAMIGAANRDPQRFTDPDRLDITRDPNPHLGFGHGIHFCLGAALARLEARVALTDLLTLAPTLELASDAPWPPRKALLVHGPERLPVRLAARDLASNYAHSAHGDPVASSNA